MDSQWEWRGAWSTAVRPQSDPADRLLVTTAREMNVPLLTRDVGILAYGEAGNVKTQRC
jgi:PIN domain nuclease of toxin-antitoxin system